MLRYAFLKSDFHPQFLILGEPVDFEQLASILDDFARHPRDLVVPRSRGSAPETDAELVLRPANPAIGVLMPADRRSFEWKLDAEWAGHFASRVTVFARSDDAAASEMLEIGGDLDEVPVKVSRGEFTGDFLVDLS